MSQDKYREKVRKLTRPAITQQNLAEELKINLSYFNKWLKQDLELGAKSMKKIKDYLK